MRNGRALRSKLPAIALVAMAAAFVIPAPGEGWNQTAHYALVRSLAQGHLEVDRTQYEIGSDLTGDLSYYKGHYYSAKGPGLAFAALPAFLLVKAAGYGKPVPNPSRLLWFLTLPTTVLAAIILLFLVRRIGDDVAPGWGVAAAVAVGGATMILPYASLFFAHSLSAMLAFAAFALVWIERAKPTRLRTLWLAGALAALAVFVEYPVALIALVVGLFAITRRPVLDRGIAYGAGFLAGIIPSLLFNYLAVGSATHFPYSDVLGGLNRTGFFGLRAPRFDVAIELLFSSIGLVTLMPIVMMGAVGIVLVYRGGRRVEALALGAVVLVYFLFNTGLETPFGGWTPGPRYLVPMLPFLAVPLAAAFRRYPLTTAVLTIGSAFQMVALTITQPLWAVFGGWFHRVATGTFSQTAIGYVGSNDLGVALFLLLLVVAAVAVAAAVPRVGLSTRDALTAVTCLVAWIVLADKGPGLMEGDALGAGHGHAAVLLFALALGLAAVVLPRLLLPRAAPETTPAPTG